MIINMGIIIVNTSETQSSLLTTVALLHAVLELLSHMIFINSFFFFSACIWIYSHFEIDGLQHVSKKLGLGVTEG